MYYLLSYEKTHKEDIAFTFWRTSQRGYCWFKEWAGVYDKAIALECSHLNRTMTIHKNSLEELWTYAIYEDKAYHVILNTDENRKLLNINLQYLVGYNKTISEHDLLFTGE